jgi:hypothetical protein
MFPVAMECLASELEATKSDNTLLVLENQALQKQIKELLSEKAVTLSDNTEKYMAEVETEVLVRIASKLAPVMGMTKGENFDTYVRRALEKQ